MNKKSQILLIISVLFMGILITGGSFAYWTLTSDVNKNVVFNTSKELAEYINYDEGESTFVGDFKVSDSYLDGIHSTISISKKEEARDVSLAATLNLNIKSIGSNMANIA